MEYKLTGIIPIIIGLIFIIFPIFSADFISILIGLIVLVFGLGLLYSGIATRDISQGLSMTNLVLGVIMIVFGFLFLFEVNAVSFLVGLQFYIVGFMLIVVGVLGLLGTSLATKTGSLINLLLGIVIIVIASYAANSPIIITMILGIVMIANGLIRLISSDNA